MEKCPGYSRRMPKRSCAICVYWNYVEICKKEEGKGEECRGECRRYAPGPAACAPWMWPDTVIGDWCGESKDKKTSGLD